MSDPTNVFEENNTPETPAQPSSDNPFADQLSAIKNDQGEQKYKDVETALKALEESQRYIQQLKSEKEQAEQAKREREEELAKMGSIEDFVKRVSPPSPTSGEPKDHEAPKGLSEEDVAKLVEAKLSNVTKQQQEDKNLQTVVSKLQEKFGDKTADHIKAVAEQTNTPVSELQNIAKSNPTLALKLLDSDVAKPTTVPSSTLPNFSNPISNDKPLERPVAEKGESISRGGLTDKELRERFQKSKAYTNARLGISE